MPAELGAPEAPPTSVRVTVAPLLEMALALFEISHACEIRARGYQKQWSPWLLDFEERHPELRDRLLAFWDDEGYHEWGELLVLAWRGDAMLEQDLPRLFARLDKLAGERFDVPELRTEPDSVRPIVVARLKLLRESRERRAEYVHLLREFWAILQPMWAANGEETAESLVRNARALLDAGRPLEDILPKSHLAHREVFQNLIAEAVVRGELVIAPLGLTSEGQYFFAVPGMVVVGYGRETERRLATRREAAERAAQRFKVLSDPTRAGICAWLLDWPLSIGDLAQQFGLSQPTISVHMKLLREAGLVEWEKRGAHTVYVTRQATLRQFVEEALEEIVPESA